jgi:putative molybdopterin biosynthesis protein
MRKAPFAKGSGAPGQEQFLHVVDRDEAERRFRAAVDLAPRGIEPVALDEALGRVLAVDVTSPVDVPSFDRANVDGFAVIA